MLPHLRALALNPPNRAALFYRGMGNVLSARCFCALPSLAQIAGERFAFVNLHVGVECYYDQIIDHIASHQATWPPVIGGANHMYHSALNAHWLGAIRDQGLRLHMRAFGGDGHPVAVGDVLFRCQGWADLDKWPRLKFRKP